MQLRGIVMSAALDENPPGSDRIELTLWLQGVGPGKPRRIVVPYELLLNDPALDADAVQGHGFEAEVEQDESGRWIVGLIGFADGRVLRDPARKDRSLGTIENQACSRPPSVFEKTPHVV